MKVSDIEKVMKKCGKAWEKRDSDLILECFTKKGIYQESPLNKPYKGHKEIKNFWNENVVKGPKEIKFKLLKCYVSEDGKTGFAEWECERFHKWGDSHMVGIMILEMEGDKISKLNEYWNTEGKL